MESNDEPSRQSATTAPQPAKKAKDKSAAESDLAKPLRKMQLLAVDADADADADEDAETRAARADGSTGSGETASDRWQRKVAKKMKQLAKRQAAHGDSRPAASTAADSARARKKSAKELSYPTEEKRTEEWRTQIDAYFERHGMPVKTRYSAESGFGLVATRPIRKGEVVVRECLFLATVCENVKERVCGHCFKHTLPQPADRFQTFPAFSAFPALPTSSGSDAAGVCTDMAPDPASFGPGAVVDGKLTTLCAGCRQMFYCSSVCLEANKKFHTSVECSALSLLGVDAIHPDDVFADLLRQALRMIALKLAGISTQPLPDETLMKNDYASMQRNLAFSPPLADDNDALLRTVSKLANELVPSSARIPLPEFVDLFKRHQCNAFSMLGPSRMDTTYGCYITCWHLMNHSCVPVLMREHHAFHRPLVDGLPLYEARAVVDVQEGDEITWCYSNIRDAPQVRREKLRQFYGFLCECRRCQEGETRCLEKFGEYRALLCKRKNCGFILPLTEDERRRRGGGGDDADGGRLLLGFCNQCGLSRYSDEGDASMDE